MMNTTDENRIRSAERKAASCNNGNQISRRRHVQILIRAEFDAEYGSKHDDVGSHIGRIDYHWQ